MKKLLLIAAAAILFASCHKSADNVVTTTPVTYSILGTWYYTTDTLRVYTNGVLQSTTPYSYNRTNYLQFNSDLTGAKLADTTLTAFTYSASGQEIIMKFPVTVAQSTIARLQSVSIKSSPSYIDYTAELTAINSTTLSLFYPRENLSADGTTYTTESAHLSK
jgi:hypothetical protein